MSFTRQGLKDLTQLLRAAARLEIMPRFRRLDAGAIRTKSSDTDLVTDADEAAEAMITAGLRSLFPGCVVVGEEATAADPGLLDQLAEAELAFVVDPIDGTANYAAGLPLFGVMAAAVSCGEVVAAAIHDPVGDDTALALRGQGAWIEAADGGRTELRVAQPAPPDRMHGAVSWRYMTEPMRSAVASRLPRLGGSWDYRCAAHEYRMLAAGHCHFLVFNRLMPWDHLPGWLLHREAGGVAARFDRSEYRPGHVGGGLICAPDQACWESLRAALFEAA